MTLSCGETLTTVWNTGEVLRTDHAGRTRSRPAANPVNLCITCWARRQDDIRGGIAASHPNAPAAAMVCACVKAVPVEEEIILL